MSDKRRIRDRVQRMGFHPPGRGETLNAGAAVTYGVCPCGSVRGRQL